MLAKQAWSVMGGLAAALAALIAKRAIAVSWRGVTGKQPPANPESPETTWAEAVGFAVLSGTVLGLARLFARRAAARSWYNATGNLPPGLESVQ